MLKLGTVRWRGRCSRHQGYNPVTDGVAGIRGDCPRCNLLLEIYTHHREVLRLMREFQPVESRPKPRAQAARAGIQQSLFGEA